MKWTENFESYFRKASEFKKQLAKDCGRAYSLFDNQLKNLVNSEAVSFCANNSDFFYSGFSLLLKRDLVSATIMTYVTRQCSRVVEKSDHLRNATDEMLKRTRNNSVSMRRFHYENVLSGLTIAIKKRIDAIVDKKVSLRGRANRLLFNQMLLAKDDYNDYKWPFQKRCENWERFMKISIRIQSLRWSFE
ncbi:hypothetical protein L596_017357 [Steinernema carpocapsae]|uniref:Uncharacterized protein n=1 Tax=Steinernema carpocapsae TaxID=34508 RepID=A0A4V6A1S2_STECR|nr:hypothetical protein L596_017357 [Steinernema carpocapsae]